MVAILFEGKSDKEFFHSLLDECHLDNYQIDKTQVVFKNFEGKDNLFNISHTHYNNIETDIAAGKIEKILLIVDADNETDPNPNRGYEASEKKLQEIIDNLGFDIPMDYHIMCDTNQKGNLESFLLSVLEDNQKECIQKFRDCYKYELTDKWVYNTFYKQKKYQFYYKHSNFTPLKQKLYDLFS
jgi:hypothetical protein